MYTYTSDRCKSKSRFSRKALLEQGYPSGPSSSTLTSKNGPDFLTTPSQLQKPRLGALWVVYIYV